MSFYVAKKLVQRYIPTIATLYFVLWIIFGLPAVEWVLGLLAVFSLIIGLYLKYIYRNQIDDELCDGFMVLENTPGGKLFSLELTGDPEDLELKDVVIFKVNNKLSEG